MLALFFPVAMHWLAAKHPPPQGRDGHSILSADEGDRCAQAANRKPFLPPGGRGPRFKRNLFLVQSESGSPSGQGDTSFPCKQSARFQAPLLRLFLPQAHSQWSGIAEKQQVWTKDASSSQLVSHGFVAVLLFSFTRGRPMSRQPIRHWTFGTFEFFCLCSGWPTGEGKWYGSGSARGVCHSRGGDAATH